MGELGIAIITAAGVFSGFMCFIAAVLEDEEYTLWFGACSIACVLIIWFHLRV